MATTLLRNATLVDGTGAPAAPGHLLLDGDTIADVLRGDQAPDADRVLDVEGRVVAPGFVDMHSHADFSVVNPDHERLMAAFLEQGVTSIVAGNCGISPAPARERTLPRLKRFASIAIDAPLAWDWKGFDGYLGRLEAARPAVNVAQLVGHSTLRYAGSDVRRGPLSSADTRRCLDLTAAAFEQGACGLSFGLGYDPGMFSPLEELEAFMRVAAAHDRTVTVHLKAYSKLSPTYPLTELRPHNLRALREMLDLARRTGARLQISHFIFVGRAAWPTASRALAMVDAARRDHDVAFDAFPYTCGNTTVNVTLPYWFLAMGAEAYRSRWARMRLRAELSIGYRLAGMAWSDFQVMEIGVPEWRDLEGLSLEAIARRWKQHPVDALLRISERTDGGALMLIHGYSGDRAGRGPIEDVLSHEACLFETDAIVRSHGWPNPAAMGTFPKILGDHVRRRGRLRLEEAVRRMTGDSVARFGLTDRGVLARGKRADVVVFDPDVIEDTPPGPSRPAGRPEGIDRVFVNGVEAVTEGRYRSGVRAGRVLR
ncbi:MAG TPA: amidohydrolase family protein [Sandaracinaceae bacterium LLY-WYZ-13_1]|nr:amidohydrolase family protein [Sandaracinaceae bacterium LLY-WYZ-13_1]